MPSRRHASYGEDEDAALTVRRREFQRINMFRRRVRWNVPIFTARFKENLAVLFLISSSVSRQSAANPGHIT